MMDEGRWRRDEGRETRDAGGISNIEYPMSNYEVKGVAVNLRQGYGGQVSATAKHW